MSLAAAGALAIGAAAPLAAQTFRDDALHFSAGYIIATTAYQLDRPTWQAVGAASAAGVLWEVARPDPDARDALITVTGALTAWAWHAVSGWARRETPADTASPPRPALGSPRQPDTDRERSEQVREPQAGTAGRQRALAEHRAPGALAELLRQHDDRLTPAFTDRRGRLARQ